MMRSNADASSARGVEASHYSIEQFLDDQQIGAAHRWMLLICALVMWVDAFDSFVVGKIAPAIAAGFHVQPAAMTRVFLIQQIGLAVGAFAATSLADRYGRQRMIVISIAAFGVFSLISALATSLDAFAILRGLGGLFLTGVLPMVVALIAESVPRRRRGTFISLAFVAYSAGTTAGGVVAVWLLERFGWQSVFVFGGVVPLLLVPLVLLIVPESSLFLVETGAPPENIRANLLRFGASPTISSVPLVRNSLESKPSSRAGFRTLFDSNHRLKTVFIWAATFLSMGSIALMAAWMPTFFQEMAGIPIKRFALYSLIGFIGGMAGSLTSGWLIDKTSATAVVPIYYVGLSLSMVALGWLWSDATIFVGAIVLFNLFQTGGQAVLNVLMSQLYPTAARSTGIGWSGGMGRIGGVILPLFGGLALERHYSIGLTLTLIAAIPLCVVVFIRLLQIVALRPLGHQGIV
jgi:MFS transporter, AAHS family, 4-hydroxybenzoate transporter